MIDTQQGDILEASSEALDNTVNTVWIMGKGVALQFRLAFRENYKAYAKLHRNVPMRKICVKANFRRDISAYSPYCDLGDNCDHNRTFANRIYGQGSAN